MAEFEQTPAVPDSLSGLWRREEIFTPGGYRDATTRVLWLQTRRHYADLRVPLDRPVRPGATRFEAFDDEDLVRLAAVQGFAGVLTATGDTCLWRRDLDYQPPGPVPDEARFEIEGDRMAELGLHADYTEIWRRQPETAAPLIALRGDGDPGGRLVIAGDHFLEMEARRAPLPAGADLAAIVARDLGEGRRDLAISRLDMRICYGRIAGGERPWQVMLSSLPWLEGRSLSQAPIAFDPVRARLRMEGVGDWRVVGSTVPLDEVALALAS